LKIGTIDDSTTADTDPFVLPATPIYQPGTFGAIEPAISHVQSDIVIPAGDYKWNQIVELQLADGKKVCFLTKKKRSVNIESFVDDRRSNKLGDNCRR